MSNKSPISVCIIAGNEAARIRRALESVADWTSEIVVVMNDDVSDDTGRIAESFGAKVYREPWKGFVGQKNSAADKASSAWLLNLDADEEVSPLLRDEIQNVVANDAKCDAFSFPRLTKFCGRWIHHGDWRPDRQTRLWRRGKARWIGGRIHETPQVDGSIGELRGDLLHHMADSIDSQIKKISSYSTAFASDAAEKDRGASWFDLLVRPLFRFVRSYVLKFGFLDGWQGLYIAWMTAFYTATRYAKIRAAAEARKS